MRTIPEALRDHLGRQPTTLAACWRLTRKDGVVLGFTDHDAALDFDETRFEAATGLTGSEAEAALGLAAATREVEGALSSVSITAEDIRAGRYDGATVETFAVNWQAPEEHVLLDVSRLGEVKHGETGFSAELRGLAAGLDRVRGRLYRRRCDAVLGDERCGVTLDAPGMGVEAVVVSATAVAVVVKGGIGGGIEGAPQRFVDGLVVFLDGAAAGIATDIAAASRQGAGLRLAFAEALAVVPKSGDRMRLSVGCDKRFATCCDRFANSVNFRGFPHMPGSDAALAVAKTDGLHDGSPVVK